MPVRRVEVYRRADKLWDWRLQSVNGQIIATSGGQRYSERGDALEGWERVASEVLMLMSGEPSKAVVYVDG